MPSWEETPRLLTQHLGGLDVTRSTGASWNLPWTTHWRWKMTPEGRSEIKKEWWTRFVVSFGVFSGIKLEICSVHVLLEVYGCDFPPRLLLCALSMLDSGSYKLNNFPHLSLSSLEFSRVERQAPRGLYSGTRAHSRPRQGALRRRVGQMWETTGEAGRWAESGKEGAVSLPSLAGASSSPSFTDQGMALRAEAPNARLPTLFCPLRALKKEKPITSHYFISKAF